LKKGKKVAHVDAGEIVRIIRRRDPENVPAVEQEMDEGLAEKHAELRAIFEMKIDVHTKINLRAAVHEEIRHLSEDAMTEGNWQQIGADPSELLGELDDDYRSNPVESQVNVQVDSEFQNPADKWDLVFDKTSSDPTEWFSADWYPTRRWNSKRLGREVCLIINLFRNGKINGSQIYKLCEKLTSAQRKRVWELFKIEKFLNNRKTAEQMEYFAAEEVVKPSN